MIYVKRRKHEKRRSEERLGVKEEGWQPASMQTIPYVVFLRLSIAQDIEIVAEGCI